MSKENVTMEVPCIELTNEDLSAVSAGKFNAFVIGDIKGESTDSGHRDWIEVLRYSHEITQPPAGR